MRRSKKLKIDGAEEKFIPILDAAGRNILILEFKLPSGLAVDLENDITRIYYSLVALLRALSEVHSVFVDTRITFRMAGRYPWRNSGISKSDHMRLVWFQFVNHCYLLEEKTKLFYEQYKIVAQIFSLDFDPKDLTRANRKIKKELGSYIRARGQTFHGWYDAHQEIALFSAAELVHSIDPMVVPSIRADYSEAKNLLRIDVKIGLDFMKSFFIELVDRHSSCIMSAITKFDRLMELVEGGKTNSFSIKKGKVS